MFGRTAGRAMSALLLTALASAAPAVARDPRDGRPELSMQPEVCSRTDGRGISMPNDARWKILYDYVYRQYNKIPSERVLRENLDKGFLREREYDSLRKIASIYESMLAEAEAASAAPNAGKARNVLKGALSRNRKALREVAKELQEKSPNISMVIPSPCCKIYYSDGTSEFPSQGCRWDYSGRALEADNVAAYRTGMSMGKGKFAGYMAGAFALGYLLGEAGGGGGGGGGGSGSPPTVVIGGQ
ncbi:MAG: hypothetical protein HYW25_06265 [Candidatus Aenigmarchaeota archaeon]|nr:hypothetical protein [Candidatus Aenigmarchaeota archaeon]